MEAMELVLFFSEWGALVEYWEFSTVMEFRVVSLGKWVIGSSV